MMYPPDLQERLVRIPALTDEERSRLQADVFEFTKREIAVHGRMRHDAYPNLYTFEPSAFEMPRSFTTRLMRTVRGALSLSLTR